MWVGSINLVRQDRETPSRHKTATSQPAGHLVPCWWTPSMSYQLSASSPPPYPGCHRHQQFCPEMLPHSGFSCRVQAYPAHESQHDLMRVGSASLSSAGPRPSSNLGYMESSSGAQAAARMHSARGGPWPASSLRAPPPLLHLDQARAETSRGSLQIPCACSLDQR